MEFVIISSPSIEEKKAAIGARIRSGPRLSAPEDTLDLFDFGGLFVATSQHQSNDVSAIGFDGFALSDRKAFSSGSKTAPPMASANGYLDGCLDKINRSELRGVFTLVRVNPHTKAFSVVTDSLSHYPVFICGFGETLIVSNNLYLVEAAVAALGERLTRNSRSGAFDTAFGYGGADRTGFREVALLPAGQLVTGVGPNWRLVSMAPPATPAFDSYSECIETTAHRLIQNLRTIATAPTHNPMTFEASGRLGTRLLIAAGSNAKLLADIQIVRSRNHRHRPFADLIARQYGLGIADHCTEEDVPSLTPAETMSNHIFRQQGFVGGAIAEACAWTSAQEVNITDAGEMALRSIVDPLQPSGLFWQAPFRNIAKISANDPIYSECLASYVRRLNQPVERLAARWAHELCNRAGHDHDLFRRDFFRNGTGSIIKQLQQLSPENGSLGNAMYLQDTSRRTLGPGLSAANRSMAMFAPLMDPLLVTAATYATQNHRQPGQFLFDLMKTLAGPSIFDTPFAADSLSSPMTKSLARHLGRKEKAIVSVGKHPPKTGGTIRLMAGLQGEFLALAKALPTENECWQYLDRNRLIAELASFKKFSKNEREAEQGLKILQILIWAAGAESKEPEP